MDWERILRPELLSLLIPLAAILVVGAIGMARLVIRHRERLAMIEHGKDPDATPPG